MFDEDEYMCGVCGDRYYDIVEREEHRINEHMNEYELEDKYSLFS